ncbi:hypothetical protein RSAG8_02543, partial [Rhizoctonia solani AG-8 WAC10335]
MIHLPAPSFPAAQSSRLPQREQVQQSFLGRRPISGRYRWDGSGLDGVTSRFHHIWLRDHCRCADCLHPVTKQRLVNTFEIPPDVQPVRVESRSAGLEVIWTESPRHTSTFPWEWLSQSSYDPPMKHSLTLNNSRKPLWGSSIQQYPPTVSYEEVMKDDVGVYRWLQKIDEFGFSFISGVPPNPEATEALTRRIAFIRDTKYGGFWDFTSDLKHGDTAYTNLALGAHTDTTYLVGSTTHPSQHFPYRAIVRCATLLEPVFDEPRCRALGTTNCRNCRSCR